MDYQNLKSLITKRKALLSELTGKNESLITFDHSRINSLGDILPSLSNLFPDLKPKPDPILFDPTTQEVSLSDYSLEENPSSCDASPRMTTSQPVFL